MFKNKQKDTRFALKVLRGWEGRMIRDKANTAKIEEKLKWIKCLNSELPKTKSCIKNDIFIRFRKCVLKTSSIAVALNAQTEKKLINKCYMFCVIAVTDTIQQLAYDAKKIYTLFPIPDCYQIFQPSGDTLKKRNVDGLLNSLFKFFLSDKYVNYLKKHSDRFCSCGLKHYDFDFFSDLLRCGYQTKDNRPQSFIIVGCYFPLEPYGYEMLELFDPFQKHKKNFVKEKFESSRKVNFNSRTFKNFVKDLLKFREEKYSTNKKRSVVHNIIVDFTIVTLNDTGRHEIYCTRNRQCKGESVLRVNEDYILLDEKNNIIGYVNYPSKNHRLTVNYVTGKYESS